MDLKIYRINTKRLTEDEKSLSIDVRGVKKGKVITRANVDLSIYCGLILTQANHVFEHIINSASSATSLPEYRVSPDLQDATETFTFLSSMEEIDATPFSATQLTDMKSMFCGCDNLKYVNLSGVDTSKVVNFSLLFLYCSSLEKIDGVFDLSSIKEDNISFLNNMFGECPSTLKVKFKNVPSNFFDKVQIGNDPFAMTCLERMHLKPEQVEVLS